MSSTKVFKNLKCYIFCLMAMHDYYLLLVGTGIDELLGCRVLESSKYVNNHRNAVNTIIIMC